MPKNPIYYGPKGGKWANPEHTIAWKEGGDKPAAEKQTSLFPTPRKGAGDRKATGKRKRGGGKGWTPEKELAQTQQTVGAANKLFSQALDALKARHAKAVASGDKKKAAELAAQIKGAGGEGAAGVAGHSAQTWPKDVHGPSAEFWTSLGNLKAQKASGEDTKRVLEESQKLSRRMKAEAAASKLDRSKAIKMTSLAQQMDEFAKMAQASQQTQGNLDALKDVGFISGQDLKLITGAATDKERSDALEQWMIKEDQKLDKMSNRQFKKYVEAKYSPTEADEMVAIRAAEDPADRAARRAADAAQTKGKPTKGKPTKSTKSTKAGIKGVLRGALEHLIAAHKDMNAKANPGVMGAEAANVENALKQFRQQGKMKEVEQSIRDKFKSPTRPNLRSRTKVKESRAPGKKRKASKSPQTSLFSKALLNKAGPYIGPRGGKWADPQHKVPYHEPADSRGFGGYYAADSTTSLDEIAQRYWQHGDKATDRSMPLSVPPSELMQHREYQWSRQDARRSPAEWDDLKEQMRGGWNPKEPLILQVGRKGGIKVGEGNHRLAVAKELGIKEIPVKVVYQSGKVTKSPRPIPGKTKAAQPKAPRPQKRHTSKEEIDALMGLFSKALLNKAGPYIGPRGGKWADPQHKVPWTDKVAAHFHSAPAHHLESIQEHGLQARKGAGTFNHGVYGSHSQGKVFLSGHHEAAKEWHWKVENMMEHSHDDESKHKVAMLRVKPHKKAEVDPIGDKDVPGSLQLKQSVPPEHIEYHDKEHGWRPIKHWKRGRSAPVSEKDAHHPGTEASRVLEHRKKQQADEKKRQKESNKVRSAYTAKVQKEKEKWAKKTPEERQAEAKRLAGLPAPIPGSSMLDFGGVPWREILGVDRKGNLINKAAQSHLFARPVYYGPRGGKWSNPEHTIPWGKKTKKRRSKAAAKQQIDLFHGGGQTPGRSLQGKQTDLFGVVKPDRHRVKRFKAPKESPQGQGSLFEFQERLKQRREKKKVHPVVKMFNEAEKKWEAFDAEPSRRNLGNLSKAWATVAQNYELEDFREVIADLSKHLKSEDDIPDNFQDFTKEYLALSKQVKEYFPDAPAGAIRAIRESFSLAQLWGMCDPQAIRAALKLMAYQEHLKGFERGVHKVTWKEIEERFEGIFDPKRKNRKWPMRTLKSVIEDIREEAGTKQIVIEDDSTHFSFGALSDTMSGENRTEDQKRGRLAYSMLLKCAEEDPDLVLEDATYGTRHQIEEISHGEQHWFFDKVERWSVSSECPDWYGRTLQLPTPSDLLDKQIEISTKDKSVLKKRRLKAVREVLQPCVEGLRAGPVCTQTFKIPIVPQEVMDAEEERYKQAIKVAATKVKAKEITFEEYGELVRQHIKKTKAMKETVYVNAPMGLLARTQMHSIEKDIKQARAEHKARWEVTQNVIDEIKSIPGFENDDAFYRLFSDAHFELSSTPDYESMTSEEKEAWSNRLDHNTFITVLERAGLLKGTKQERGDENLKKMVPADGSDTTTKDYDYTTDPYDLRGFCELINPEVMPSVEISLSSDRSLRAHITRQNTIRMRGMGDFSPRFRESPRGRAILKERTGTFWHEMGHGLEHDSSGITDAASALRDERGKGESIRGLASATGNSSYSANEKTYEDQWNNPYTGKWYGHLSSTEIVSMGLQNLRDPREFSRQDYQHFLFTLAAISGKLGKRDQNVHPSEWMNRLPGGKK